MSASTWTGAAVARVERVGTLRSTLRERPLELPYAGLPGVLGGDQPQRVVGDSTSSAFSRPARSSCRGSRWSRAIATFSSSV